MKKLLVLGAGESGIGAALLGKAKGYDVFVSDFGSIDEQQKKILKKEGIPFEEGSHDLAPKDASIVVKSPGIPDTVPIIQLLKKNNCKICSEIEFASWYTEAKIIAITGTNGKTTTTKLIYHFLEHAGYNVGLAGNIGISFAKQVLENQFDWFVLEISSFQLDDIHNFHPNISLILNITPDHLDRYSYDIQKYALSKFRIIENMTTDDTFIFGQDDKVTNDIVQKSTLKPNSIGFSNTFLKNNQLDIPFNGKVYHFDKLPLKGPHNAWNMSAAILTALASGISAEKIQDALPSFVGEPHRLQHVRILNDVSFINDSKATNVEASLFALQSFEEPIVWIAGGTDKGNDYTNLLSVAKENVKALICLGVDNSKLIDAFTGLFPIEETQNTAEAIQLALKHTEKNNIVLLAPACASFDLYKNYMDRGDKFMEEVNRLT